MFNSFINCRDYFTLLFVLGCCHFEGTRAVSGVLFSAQLPLPPRQVNKQKRLLENSLLNLPDFRVHSVIH